MKTTVQYAMQAALCFVVFVIIQFAVMLCTRMIVKDITLNATALIVSSLVASAITIALFAWRRWTVMSRNYIYSRPWSSFVWIITAAIGIIPLSSLLLDFCGLRISNDAVRIYANMINHEFGYITIGIIAPVAEEIVFRGAILCALLKVFDKRMHWVAIAVSAVLFGIVHGNMAQGVNATLIGLLLGWMYYKTDSIVPGVIFHWTNNTIVYVMMKLMPGTYNMTMSEFCGGDTRKIAILTVCALCVLIPSIFQLTARLKKK